MAVGHCAFSQFPLNTSVLQSFGSEKGPITFKHDGTVAGNDAVVFNLPITYNQYCF